MSNQHEMQKQIDAINNQLNKPDDIQPSEHIDDIPNSNPGQAAINLMVSTINAILKVLRKHRIIRG